MQNIKMLVLDVDGTLTDGKIYMGENGEVFKDYSDIAEIIEDGKKELLKNPRDFYTTNKYSVEMVSCKGKWRVIMSDEFYNALSGYAL